MTTSQPSSAPLLDAGDEAGVKVADIDGNISLPGSVEQSSSVCEGTETTGKGGMQAGEPTTTTTTTGNAEASSTAQSTVQGQYETMCRAARDGDLGTVESLLGAGVPPDLPVSQQQTAENDKKHGMTPLLWASERGHVPVVKALLKADARLDATDPFCMTSLHWASARGHKDIVCLLVAAGAKLNAVEQDQMTPLHLAATQGQKATVVALLNLGADPDAEGKEKWPPLLWAAHKGNSDVVEVLCTAHGQTKRHMQQALHLACEMGHTSVVEALVKAGAAVNQPGPDRMAPVHRATLKGHTAVVQLLLANGARLAPFRKDKHNLNHTPLHWAAAKGNVEICEALLGAGQEVNTVDKRNWTALHWATEKGHRSTVKLLLENGADVNAVDKDNRTPLRFAAVQGYVEVLDELITKGAILDASDKTQMTSLHWAAKKGRVEVVQRLLASGANPVLLDKDTCCARDLATAGGFTDVAAVLKDAELKYVAAHPGAELPPARHENGNVLRSERQDKITSMDNSPQKGGAHEDDPQPKGCLCFRF
eukprot:jgi/Tetstr1/428593/TSEL_018586.t2